VTFLLAGLLRTTSALPSINPSIEVKVKLEAVTDFLKGLKGQDVEVSLSSLSVSCDALRAGEQTININVDPVAPRR